MEKDRDRGGFLPVRADRRVAELASAQGGRVSRDQLREAGLGEDAIDHRSRSGWLHREHRGVYSVGHPASTLDGRLWAAVLATGGVLSHRTAAALWDLSGWIPERLDVTTPGTGRSTRLIRVHHGALDPAEIRQRDDGLRLTSPMRTLVDRAATEPPYAVKRLIHRAAHLDLLDASYDPAGRRGARRLRRAIASLAIAPPQITRSELEERLLKLVDDAKLPPPRVNHARGDYTCDFVWPHLMLIVETDGARTHNTDAAFHADRRRDIENKIAGYETLRFTWAHVVDDPRWVAEALSTTAAARANARPRSSGPSRARPARCGRA